MDTATPLMRSSLMLGIYLACLALVASFVFFEVLDVDGSSFPASPVSASLSAESQEGVDVRRGALATAGHAGLALAALPGARFVEADRLGGDLRPPGSAEIRPVARPQTRLARSALADSPEPA